MSDSDRGEDFGHWWVTPGFVALATVFITVFGYAYWATTSNWNESQENSKHIEAYSNRYAVERCNRLYPVEKDECIKEAAQAAQDQQRNEADLYAQRQMAVWALVVAICAAVSIPLSVAGIFFVWRSLALNREAVAAATTANANTLRAIEQEQANAERGIRAYVTPGNISVSKFDIGLKSNFRCVFKNSGQTPAFQFRFLVDLFPVIDPEKSPLRFTNTKWNMQPSIVLAGGEKFERSVEAAQIVTRPVYEGIVGGDVKFMFFGVYSYRDIFGKKRRGVFRTRLDPTTLSETNADFAVCLKNNRTN